LIKPDNSGAETMRAATLVYNWQAGGAARVTVGELEDALAGAGYRTRSVPLEETDEIEKRLETPHHLVVAAGGDGTVRAIASRLAGRNAPLAIVPLGTANNIAASLGLDGLTPLEAIAGLAHPRPTRFDIGIVDGPWGSTQFLESAGTGLFADLLAAYDPGAGKSVVRAAESVMHVLPGYEGRRYRLRVDGQDLSNDYLLAEVMNTPRIAWKTPLAPSADPCDGRLDLVLVGVDDRFGFTSYLKSLAAGDFSAHPAVTVRRCRRVDLMWEDDAPIHVDEEVHDARDGNRGRLAPSTVSFTLTHGLVDVWLPQFEPEPHATAEDLRAW
jgi:diacylglycerol kinase family enzyme